MTLGVAEPVDQDLFRRLTVTAAVMSARTVSAVEMFHLRYFLAVAHERNFTRAAESLHMAASPLSRRIRELESELGTPLFVRGHHRIDLTDAGHTLLPHATALVEQFDAVPGLVRPTGDSTAALDIGVASDVTGDLRSAVHDAIIGACPAATITFHPGATEPLLEALRRGDLDAALLHGPVVDPDIESVRLHTATVGVAVGRNAGFDGRRSVRLDELTHLAFASIQHDAAPAIYRSIDELLRRHGIHKRITLQDHNFGGLAHVVAGGGAFSLVGSPLGAMAKAFVGEPVDILEVDGTNLRLSTVAAWRTASGSDGASVDLPQVFRSLAATPRA